MNIRGAQAVTIVIVAVMTISALALFEPWPFSSFRMFSQLRTDQRQGWSLTAVTDSGQRVTLPATTDRGFRNLSFQLDDFRRAEQGSQDRRCRGLFLLAKKNIPAAEKLVINRQYWLLSAPEKMTEATFYQCDESGLIEGPGGSTNVR